MTADVSAFYPSAVRQTGRLRPASAHDFDDLVQEAVIAGWLATREGTRTNPITYGRVAGGRRILGIVSGRVPMTGSENPGRRTHDLARREDRRATLADEFDVEAPGDEAEACALRVDVARALEHLEPRDRILAREVADGSRWADVGPLVGLSPTGARNRWYREVRPALRELLGPLVAA